MAVDITGFNRMRRQQVEKAKKEAEAVQVKKKLPGKSSKKRSSKKGEGYV